MIYGIICDKLGKPIREFWIYNSSTIHQTEHFFFILFIAILIEILVMLIWKEYNYLRFGRLKRRKFKPDVLEKEIDEYFELKEDIKNALHHDKYIVLYKNPIPEGIGQGRGNKKRRPAENNSTAGRPGNR